MQLIQTLVARGLLAEAERSRANEAIKAAPEFPPHQVLIDKGFEPGIDPSAQLINLLDGKAALLLIQHLPLAYRRVMRMRYVQDLSLAEMSLLTGKSKGSLAVQLHRGLAKLKLLYIRG